MSNEIFISYSRKNKNFVKRLDEAFRKQGKDPWVDWEDIPPNANWREEIHEGIEKAENIIFVLSPDSLASHECGVEISIAQENGKRLIPIVYQEVSGEDVKKRHAKLQALNWIFFRENDDFDQAFKQLLEAIVTDLEHVKIHTRLQIRALEWHNNNRHLSYLIRGEELAGARQWLILDSDKQPKPTRLHREYILASKKEEERQHFRWKELYEKAVINEIKALCALSEARFIAGKQLESLFRAYKAGQKIAHINVPLKLKWEIIASFLHGIQEVARLKGHKHSILRVDIHPNGNILASAGADGTIIFWDTIAKKKILSFCAHTENIYALAFSPNGKLLTSGGYDNTLKLWNLEEISKPKEIFCQADHLTILDATFSSDGKTLAVANSDDTIILLDVEEPNSANPHSIFNLKNISCIALSPDGKILATGNFDNEIKLLDANNGQELYSLIGHTSPINSLCFSPDEKILVSATQNSNIKLWNIDDGKELCTLSEHSGAVNRVKFTSDGKTLISASDDGTIRLWDIGDNLRTRSFLHSHLLKTADDKINFACIHPEGNLLASAGNDNILRLWNMNDSFGIQVLKGDAVKTFSEKNQWLMQSQNHQSLENIRSPNGILIPIADSHTHDVNAISINPDNQLVASASSDGTVKLWSLADGTYLCTLHVTSGRVLQVGFHPNGNFLATLDDTGRVKLWNINLEMLLDEACKWLKHYLKNAPHLTEEERKLCDE